jgi:hypothetical protein
VTNPYPTSEQVGADPAQASVGELISQVTTDVTTLMRQEFALAKAEMKQEAGKAGKAGGLLGGAGFAGYMLALFASVAVMAALDLAMPLWAAAAIVAAVYGVVAAVLYSKGRKQLNTVDPVPHQTVETVKEGMPR